MFDVVTFIKELTAKGVVLSLDGQNIKCRAPRGVLSAEDLQILRERKGDVCMALRSPGPEIFSRSEPEVESSSVRRFPLTHLQEIFVRNYSNVGRFYHMSTWVSVSEMVDPSVLRRALHHLEERHSVLRVKYVTDATGELQMAVDRNLKSDLSIVSQEATGDVVTTSRELYAALHAPSFDLEAGPLVRVGLLQKSESDALILVVIHHSIGDAWSLAVFIRELQDAYSNLHRQLPFPERAPAPQFTEHALRMRTWLVSDECRGLLEEMRRDLANVVEPFFLPPCAPNRRIVGDPQRPLQGNVSVDASQRLSRLAADHRTTLFAVCLTAFVVAIAEWRGRKDVCVVVCEMGRELPEDFRMIGCLADAGLVRVTLPQNGTLIDGLLRTETSRRRSMRFQRLPYEVVRHVLAECCGTSVVPHIVFNFIPSITRPEASGGATVPLGSGSWKLGIDAPSDVPSVADGGLQPESSMSLYFEIVESSQGLSWRVLYDKALFERDAVETFIAEVGANLRQLAAMQTGSG